MQSQSIHFHIMVPVYKVEKYLDECVQSVLDQTYQDFTLYLVDDGSPDRCGAMCDAWAEKDERIRAYHKPNSGLLHTRRFAIAKVRENGASEDDYGVFLDSDDTLCPGALETIAETVKKYECDCVIYGVERVLEGKSIARLSVPSEEPLFLRDKRALYKIVLEDPNASYYALWRKAVRLALLQGTDYTPYYHVSIGEDVLQSQEIYRNGKSFCLIPQTLYHYRLNPASMTQTLRYENYRVDFTVQEAEAAFLEAEGVYTAEDMAAYRSFRIHALTGSLVNIAAMDTSRENRVELYERIRETAYWKDFLSEGTYDRRRLGKMTLIYEAFRHRAYWFIFLAVGIYRR